MVFKYKPRLTEEEFDKFMESYYNLIRARRYGQLSQVDYEREKKRLYENLKSVVASGDVRYFQNIDDLRSFLLEIMTYKKANEKVKHEFEHGKKAEELGYTVQYGVWLMEGYNGDLVIVPFTHVQQETNSQHLDQIKAAASHQSVYDKQ